MNEKTLHISRQLIGSGLEDSVLQRSKPWLASLFAGIWKATVFKKLQSYDAALKLGDFTVPNYEIIQKFFSGHVRNRDLRIRPWKKLKHNAHKGFQTQNCWKETHSSEVKWSSTNHAFEAHCLRAHYQSAVWKYAGPLIHQTLIMPSIGGNSRLNTPSTITCTR